MNVFTKWCFRVGLVSFVGIVVLQLIGMGVNGFEARRFLQSGSALLTVAQLLFEVFIWMGIVLLVEAIVWLSRNWRRLSKPTKVGSVLGLAVGSIFSSYIFHWLIPDLERQLAVSNGHRR